MQKDGAGCRKLQIGNDDAVLTGEDSLIPVYLGWILHLHQWLAIIGFDEAGDADVPVCKKFFRIIAEIDAVVAHDSHRENLIRIWFAEIDESRFLGNKARVVCIGCLAADRGQLTDLAGGLEGSDGLVRWGSRRAKRPSKRERDKQGAEGEEDHQVGSAAYYVCSCAIIWAPGAEYLPEAARCPHNAFCFRNFLQTNAASRRLSAPRRG